MVVHCPKTLNPYETCSVNRELYLLHKSEWSSMKQKILKGTNTDDLANLKKLWRRFCGQCPNRRWRFFDQLLRDFFNNLCFHDQIKTNFHYDRSVLRHLLYEAPGDKYIYDKIVVDRQAVDFETFAFCLHGIDKSYIE